MAELIMAFRLEPIRTTAVVTTPCPACGTQLDAITGTGTPAPGDVTICASCRVFLIFTDPHLPQRLLTNAEWAQLPIDQRRLLTHVRDRLPR